ncbi:hypothetical protein SAMN05444280_12081 [Tangfeifania diversioriginum]|uniref:Uncharacterized protein n=1 Tax=Tangfeifania diversioriginum TaxID=1168035 RepID=A0A1M6JML5_9BACT|nr:hypothetical protein SAMN05444280_12081 [Tangfeifania diversioriginum]
MIRISENTIEEVTIKLLQKKGFEYVNAPNIIRIYERYCYGLLQRENDNLKNN